MPHLGPWEIVAIVAVVLIIFGVGRLPQALGALGKGVRSFRRAAAGQDTEEEVLKSKATGETAANTSDQKKS